MAARMPVVFFGHGNPMNAIQSNPYTEAWSSIGASIKPHAILCISAHWYLPGVHVTAATQPRTIHDFGGFPPELYEVRYPAPGDLRLAESVKRLLHPIPVELDQSWGLDHGTWSVLCHAYPDADIPVVQLSIDRTQPAGFHHQLGQRLSALRDDGILITGSGNIVHNLRLYDWDRQPLAPRDWAVSFENRVRESLVTDDAAALIDYESWGSDSKLSAPTAEHYLPLLYVAGARRKDDDISFPISGFEGGSISMTTVRIG